MKKTAFCVVVALLLCLFGGCSNKAGGKDNDDKAKTKFGMAIITDTDVEEDEASLSATVATVLTDTDGKIIACRLDELEIEPAIVGTTFENVTDLRTKREKGTDYGMQAAGAKQEWFAQADSFCKYVIGMTANEVAGIETMDGKPKDADLLAGCTMDVTDFMRAVSEAAKNAKEAKVAAADKLGLAVTATRYADSENTAPRYDMLFSAVTVGADGKLTGCYTDELQYTFSLIEKEATTKAQQGDGYGMKAASAIGLEWYQQIANLDAFLVGKSTADIDAVSLADGKIPDIASGCTIVVTEQMKNVQKAMRAAS